MNQAFNDWQSGCFGAEIAVASVSEDAIAHSVIFRQVCNHINGTNVIATFVGSSVFFHLAVCDATSLLVGDVDLMQGDPLAHCFVRSLSLNEHRYALICSTKKMRKKKKREKRSVVHDALLFNA